MCVWPSANLILAAREASFMLSLSLPMFNIQREAKGRTDCVDRPQLLRKEPPSPLKENVCALPKAGGVIFNTWGRPLSLDMHV